MKINAQLIKSERTKRGWTQQQLADICDLNMRTIQRIEGMGAASPDSVQTLCSVLEITSEDLLVLKRPEELAQQNFNPTKYRIQMFLVGLLGIIAGSILTLLISQ